MSVPHSVATILQDKVSLDLESIDRMYLNVYVPQLQTPEGVAYFFRTHRGATFASSALMEPITTAFIAALERYARTQGIPLLTFKKGQRKDDIAAEYRAQFQSAEGVLFMGKAQEKATVCRTEKRCNPQTGRSYPWLVRSTALVNQYYIYLRPVHAKVAARPAMRLRGQRSVVGALGNLTDDAGRDSQPLR